MVSSLLEEGGVLFQMYLVLGEERIQGPHVFLGPHEHVLVLDN